MGGEVFGVEVLGDERLVPLGRALEHIEGLLQNARPVLERLLPGSAPVVLRILVTFISPVRRERA